MKILKIYLDVIEKNLGYRPKILLNNMEHFVEIHPAKYQILYDRLFNRRFDNSKIAQYSNTKSFTNIEVGLRSCLEEFLKNPKF